VGYLHNFRREQLVIAHAGALPEDDHTSSEVRDSELDGKARHDVLDALGNGHTMLLEQARIAEHLDQTPHMTHTQTTVAADGATRVLQAERRTPETPI